MNNIVQTQKYEGLAIKNTTKIMLICGILSSILYVAIVLFMPLQWQGYSVRAQSVSELFAINAPTRQLTVQLLIVYCLLIYVFGAGVWRSASGKLSMRLSGGMIIGKEILGLAATVFFPMHLRGATGEVTDAMHIILTSVGLLFMVTAIVSGAVSNGKWFRIYSIATLMIFILFGVIAGMDGARVAADQSTPWLGIAERINIFIYMLWIMVLAVILLRNSMKSVTAELKYVKAQEAAGVDFIQTR